VARHRRQRRFVSAVLATRRAAQVGWLALGIAVAGALVLTSEPFVGATRRTFDHIPPSSVNALHHLDTRPLARIHGIAATLAVPPRPPMLLRHGARSARLEGVHDPSLRHLEATSAPPTFGYTPIASPIAAPTISSIAARSREAAHTDPTASQQPPRQATLPFGSEHAGNLKAPAGAKRRERFAPTTTLPTSTTTTTTTTILVGVASVRPSGPSGPTGVASVTVEAG
jgi:hypothetical protein